MFSKRSIRRSFLIQLIFASASLIFIFSSLLFFYIKSSIFEEKYNTLEAFAKNIAHNESMFDTEITIPEKFLGIDVEIIYLNQSHVEVNQYATTREQKTYLTIIYPFNFDDFSI